MEKVMKKAEIEKLSKRLINKHRLVWDEINEKERK